MAKANPASVRAAVPARLPVVDRRAERVPEAEPQSQKPARSVPSETESCASVYVSRLPLIVIGRESRADTNTGPAGSAPARASRASRTNT